MLSNIPSPYIIKEGIRFYRDTALRKLVSDKVKMIVIDPLNKELVFSSISECSRILQIERYKIKKYLVNGETYKNYKFKFMPHHYINFDRKEG